MLFSPLHILLTIILISLLFTPRPHTPSFPYHHHKLFRPDCSPVSIRRKRIAGYHISFPAYLLHRRMSHHLQPLLIPIHFPRCILRSVPDRGHIAPHIFPGQAVDDPHHFIHVIIFLFRHGFLHEVIQKPAMAKKRRYQSSECNGSHSPPAARTPIHPASSPPYMQPPGCSRSPVYSTDNSGHGCHNTRGYPDIFLQMRSRHRRYPGTTPGYTPDSSRPECPSDIPPVLPSPFS